MAAAGTVCWCIKNQLLFCVGVVAVSFLRYIYSWYFFNVVFMFRVLVLYLLLLLCVRAVLFCFNYTVFKIQTHLWMRDFDTVADSFNGAQWSNEKKIRFFFQSTSKQKPVFFLSLHSVNTLLLISFHIAVCYYCFCCCCCPFLSSWTIETRMKKIARFNNVTLTSVCYHSKLSIYLNGYELSEWEGERETHQQLIDLIWTRFHIASRQISVELSRNQYVIEFRHLHSTNSIDRRLMKWILRNWKKWNRTVNVIANRFRFIHLIEHNKTIA